MLAKLKNILKGVLNSGNFSSEINKFNQSSLRLNNLVFRISQAEAESHELIKTLSKQALEATLAKKLLSTPITELGRFGARVQPLLNYGILTFNDLIGYNASKLQRINGIGPSTANGIINSVSELKAHILATTSLRRVRPH